MYDIKRTFTIPQLKAMCAALGLTVGGAEEHLQGRLMTHLNMLFQRQDGARFSLAKIAAEVQRGAAYVPRVTYVPSERQKIDFFSRPNVYHASSTAPASIATPVHITSSPTNWGMSPSYQDLRLRTSSLFYQSKQIAVYKRLPFYTLLTNVTQAYSVPGILLFVQR